MSIQANLQEVLPSYLINLLTIEAVYVLLVVSLLGLAIYIFLQLYKFKKIVDQEYTLLEVKPSYKTLQSNFSTTQLFTVLHSLHKPTTFFDKFLTLKKLVSLELVSSREEGIRYMVRVLKEDTPLVKKSLLAYFPALEIKEAKDSLILENKYLSRELVLSKPFIYPLQTQSKLEDFDPISYITTQMTKLSDEDLLAVQIVFSPITSTSHGSLTEYTAKLTRMIANNEDISSAIDSNLADKILDLVLGRKSKRISDLGTSKRNQFALVEEKINEPLFESTIRVIVSSTASTERSKRMKGIISSFDTFSSNSQALKLKVNLLTHLKNDFITKFQTYVLKNTSTLIFG